MTNLPTRAFPPDAVEKLKGKVCDNCIGKGKLKVLSDKPTNFGPRFYLQNCDACQGTGRVYGECVTVEAMEQPPEGARYAGIEQLLTNPPKPVAVGFRMPDGEIVAVPLPYRIGDVVAVAEEWRGNSLYRPGTQDFTISTIAQRLGVSVADVKSVIDFDEPWQPADTMPPELADQCARARVVGVEVERAEEAVKVQTKVNCGMVAVMKNDYVALVTWRGEGPG